MRGSLLQQNKTQYTYEIAISKAAYQLLMNKGYSM